MVNSNFSKWGVFQENLSVDEMIIQYYGYHSLKQFIRPNQLGLFINYGPCAEVTVIVSIFLYIAEKSKLIQQTLLELEYTKNVISCRRPEKPFCLFRQFF